MKLTLDGLKKTEQWQEANIQIPNYNVEDVIERTKENPIWIHFGIGNIFRIFIAGIADQLINEGLLDKGITCVETFDFEVVDRVYKPYDNLSLSVILHANGDVDKKVCGCLTEAIKSNEDYDRLKEIFVNPSLQFASFTITEKGYNLKNANGNYFGFVEDDLKNGPNSQKLNSAMSIVTALLWERYQANKTPIALASMDNVSHNGKMFRLAVLDVANQWKEKGFVDDGFITYVSDETQVAFPWSMIDKIVPRPSEDVKSMLENCGVEDMDIVITDKQTYIAPFVNGENPAYLVVEDNFPNGRPPLEKAGVYMTDRDTVNASERMKVTVCLNPIHTALAPFGCSLGFKLFSDEMNDKELSQLAHVVGKVEGMHVVKDPKILSPEAFIDECIHECFPNPYLGDTPQRIAVDTSQMLGIRFGETIKEYVQRYGDAKKLTGIPLAIAGWLRYMLAIDDDGNPFELSPDPMNDEIQEVLKDISIGNKDSLKDQLKPILSNVHIFGSDLYAVGIGELIEDMFRDLIADKGAIRATLKKYLADE